MVLTEMAFFPVIEKLSGCRFFAGYYHLIGDQPPAHIKHLYACKTAARFEQDIDYLLKRYPLMDLSGLLASVQSGEPVAGRVLILTFDDGLREAFDAIAPILVRKGVPAIFFICSAFIDNREMSSDHKKSLILDRLSSGSAALRRKAGEILNRARPGSPDVLGGVRLLSYRDRETVGEIGAALEVDFGAYLRSQRPYLTGDQILGLVRQGFFVGSHSIDHPLYRDLPLEEQLRQTVISTESIVSRFGLDYRLFAFPHTDAGVSARFFALLRERRAVDLSFGTGGLLDDAQKSHIQRMSFEKPGDPVGKLIRRQVYRRIYRRLKGTGVLTHPESPRPG